MPVPQESTQSTYGCLSTIAVAGLIVAPIYLLLRYFVKLIRYRYGFAVPPEDPGPPLRICEGCHNTVLELDFQHCPYCGLLLPPVEPRGAGPRAGEAQLDELRVPGPQSEGTRDAGPSAHA